MNYYTGIMYNNKKYCSWVVQEKKIQVHKHMNWMKNLMCLHGGRAGQVKNIKRKIERKA